MSDSPEVVVTVTEDSNATAENANAPVAAFPKAAPQISHVFYTARENDDLAYEMMDGRCGLARVTSRESGRGRHGSVKLGLASLDGSETWALDLRSQGHEIKRLAIVRWNDSKPAAE